ncbi:Eco57I restriction-modification methylase domain-containing protein [Nocardia sp. alder85J]|uniref:Eco57I restriction-modification methylase domain-containing protein n=1 Tax=Nocardia sp. alder85J TaxID=2862949 RepID=UPI001CD307B6|nr:DNA methyltransferase [Nocardia sp. alder85J]MCX4093599.1 N-6 DNA methylase [Nocardia sp. alder85J]
MSGLSSFRSVRTVGTVLPSEALTLGAELRMPGQSTAEYQLPPGMAINAAIARAWEAMLATHRVWQHALTRLPEHDAATKITREKWLLPLLYELGWGRPEIVSGGLDVAPGLGETTAPHFPISHRLSWPDAAAPATWVPIHLVGAGIDLDTKTAGHTARAPQSMLQDYLNREERALWAVLSNGRTLRLLRDASTLSRQSYVEFDLDDIFTNQRYADFRLLFLTVHASRFTPRLDQTVTRSTPATEEETEDAEVPTLSAEQCWLEQWRTTAIDNGARALLTLQNGVAKALQHLGTGFLAHRGNTALRDTLAGTPDAAKDLHRALLRIAYRLIVLFVAEDRDLLHASTVDPQARQLYAEHFSTARLRRMATAHAGSRHTDLWEAHQIVTDALAGDGLPTLGLSGLGATLYSRQYLSILDEARLPNHAFLAAIRALAQIDDPVTGTPRPVDYRNLDSEELGGMYEGLLAYTPRYDADARTFTLENAAGHDRKTSGSYYTPSALIDLVLDEALDPLIDEALRTQDPEQALLDLTVVDPACGSGHFLVAAARRLASALATVRTGDTEPNPVALRTATADIIERCIYGVDLNDLAIEITKVALWLEAFDTDRPFPFLDAHLRVGNALLGTTPELLRHNIPDAAFVPLGDDDREWTSKLKARNKAERTADIDQLTLSFGPQTLDVETIAFSKAARAADASHAGSLREMRIRADAWRALETDPGLVAAKLVADAWCAAFVQHKTKTAGPQPVTTGQGITHDTLRRLSEDAGSLPDTVIAQINRLARQYRFFHWHLEFPGIFTVTTNGNADSTTGWTGGFSCVLGNPPWETLQLEDKQFFGNHDRTDIENASTAAVRKKMIEALADSDPVLYAAYQQAQRTSEGTNHLVRCGRYPLTANGKINTYSVFAETMRTLVGRRGAAGIITPTGLATDKTTAPFFSDTLRTEQLIAFYDFENEARIFTDVHHSFRFAITAIAGSRRKVDRTRFAFLIRHITDVSPRRFELAAGEVLAMNPNTGTLPMFRTRTDADITLGIYKQHPVLIRDNDPAGNPWKLSFSQGLFNMASDSNLFIAADDLADFEFNGWSYELDEREFVPLYEAKMLGHFDHRFSTYSGATQAQLNVGSLPRPTASEHDDPGFEPLARYWVDRTEVSKKLEGRWDRNWLLGWRDIVRSSDSRTFLPSVLPMTALGDPFLLAFPANPSHGPVLHAIWSSLVFDYVARQKLSGTHMKYFTVKQLACPLPSRFDEPAGWDCEQTLAEWVHPYVLELSYTSWRLRPYAVDLGDIGAPFRWDPERRALLRADLDAAFLHVYGLSRTEAEHVLDSFPVVRKYEERDLGEYRTRQLVLAAYDRMTVAIAAGGRGWTSLATRPAGAGDRHPSKNAQSSNFADLL